MKERKPEYFGWSLVILVVVWVCFFRAKTETELRADAVEKTAARTVELLQGKPEAPLPVEKVEKTGSRMSRLDAAFMSVRPIPVPEDPTLPEPEQLRAALNYATRAEVAETFGDFARIFDRQSAAYLTLLMLSTHAQGYDRKTWHEVVRNVVGEKGIARILEAGPHQEDGPLRLLSELLGAR